MSEIPLASPHNNHREFCKIKIPQRWPNFHGAPVQRWSTSPSVPFYFGEGVSALFLFPGGPLLLSRVGEPQIVSGYASSFIQTPSSPPRLMHQPPTQSILANLGPWIMQICLFRIPSRPVSRGRGRNQQPEINDVKLGIYKYVPRKTL